MVPSQAGERRAQCACGTDGSVAAASFCPPDKNPLDQHDDKHSLGGVQEHEQSRRDDEEHGESWWWKALKQVNAEVEVPLMRWMVSGAGYSGFCWSEGA